METLNKEWRFLWKGCIATCTWEKKFLVCRGRKAAAIRKAWAERRAGTSMQALVREEVQEGAMFMQSLQVGGSKTCTGAGYWRGETLCLQPLRCSLRVAQSSLPSEFNFGASVNTHQVEPTSSLKADSSPAQRLAPASLNQLFQTAAAGQEQSGEVRRENIWSRCYINVSDRSVFSLFPVNNTYFGGRKKPNCLTKPHFVCPLFFLEKYLQLWIRVYTLMTVSCHVCKHTFTSH